MTWWCVHYFLYLLNSFRRPLGKEYFAWLPVACTQIHNVLQKKSDSCRKLRIRLIGTDALEILVHPGTGSVMIKPLSDGAHNLAETFNILRHVANSRSAAQRRLLALDKLLNALVQNSLLQQIQLPQLSCKQTRAFSHAKYAKFLS